MARGLEYKGQIQGSLNWSVYIDFNGYWIRPQVNTYNNTVHHKAAVNKDSVTLNPAAFNLM